MKSKYTKQQIEKAVAQSVSWVGTLRSLGLKSMGGGSYNHVKKLVNNFGIDTSHFTGQAWNKGRSYPKVIKKNLDNYLIKKGPPIASTRLKKMLWSSGIKEKKCERCNITEWLGNPAPLELHHINGDSRDNGLDNLQVLCANCHSLTPAFAGKNKRASGVTGSHAVLKPLYPEDVRVQIPSRPLNSCVECFKSISHGGTRCCSCAAKGYYVIKWPSVDEILKKLSSISYCALGRELGVSDNAIRKHLKSKSIIPPKAARKGIQCLKD